MNRDLDGMYCIVKRNGKWDSICFSDLTDEEMDEILKDRDAEWLKSVCKRLGRTIRRIGDEQDIVGWQNDEEEV